jgi:glycosyltransferase involved in cell wall biosynthesis
MNRPELFIGITSWNSELFLPHCLEAVEATTRGIDSRICVLDNGSTDRSVAIATERGAEVVVRRCSQADALNALVNRSRSPYTLLIHADVILLADHWFPLCRARLTDGVALVSPQDIGCGPLTRPFGAGKPESSFLLLHTRRFRRCRGLHWRRQGRWPRPRYDIDFHGPHITHHLPDVLRRRRLDWVPMDVYVSNRASEPLFTPTCPPTVWSDELAYLRYGLGNFYGLDGTITHYHNWYDRIAAREKTETAPNPGRKDFPVDFIRSYTNRLLEDYRNGRLELPTDLSTTRTPRAL